jgi:hypothetical protein
MRRLLLKQTALVIIILSGCQIRLPLEIFLNTLPFYVIPSGSKPKTF